MSGLPFLEVDMAEPPAIEATRQTLGARVRQVFKRGLAALLPTLLTLVILIKAYQFLRDTVGFWLTDFWEWAFGYTVPKEGRLAEVLTVVGIFLAAVAVFLLGYFVSTVVGRWAFGKVDAWLKRLPIVRQVYPGLKQVTDFLLTAEQTIRFTDVVAVPYPRRGVYSLGFVTGRGFRQLQEATDRRMVNVFVPSSPTPISGYVVFFPEDEVVYLDISVEEAFRFVLTGGVVIPGSQGVFAVPPETLPAGGGGRSEPRQQATSQEGG